MIRADEDKIYIYKYIERGKEAMQCREGYLIGYTNDVNEERVEFRKIGKG